LPVRLLGLLVFVVPHVIGAPVAIGESSVPAELVRQFAALSILTTGMFWIALGAIGGFFYRRSGYAEAPLLKIIAARQSYFGAAAISN